MTTISTEVTVQDPFWGDLPSILFNKERLSEFYFTSDMTKTEKLNAAVRASIYIGLICVLYYNDPKFLLFPIVMIAVTYFIYNNTSEPFEDENEIEGTFGAEDVVRPTIDNPFMNPSIFDNPATFKAANYSDNSPESEKIKKDIYDKFSHNLFKDADDIYDTNNGFRQMYTVVDNGINDYDAFKEFIYGDMKYPAKENTYNSFKNLNDPLKSKKM